MRGLPAPGADLGSPLKVVRRRQASVSSLHKAKPKATSQPGPARHGAECGGGIWVASGTVLLSL